MTSKMKRKMDQAARNCHSRDQIYGPKSVASEAAIDYLTILPLRRADGNETLLSAGPDGGCNGCGRGCSF
jgi:hypothetical protein